MLEYPKIETLYNRDEKTHRVIPEQLRLAEFGNIRRWQITEKVDGTNIRIGLSPDGNVSFNGRTDNAQLPAPLVSYLQTTFTAEKLGARSFLLPIKAKCCYSAKVTGQEFRKAEFIVEIWPSVYSVTGFWSRRSRPMNDSSPHCDACRLLQNALGIRSQYPEQTGLFAQLSQRRRNRRILNMAIEVNKKDIIPHSSPRGTRFNSGHADIIASQRLQQVE